MESKVKDGGYVNIQAFMLKDLELSGNELITYAIIYGFCQDGESAFTGSLQYIADWTSSTKRSAQNILARLCEKDLIIKHTKTINNVIFNEYTINWETLAGHTFAGIEKVSTPVEKSSPNNINNNIDKENNDINIITKEKPKKERKAREFTPPTVDEVNAYSKEKGYSVDGQMFVDYYETNNWVSNGKPIANWKLKVVTWESKNRERKKTNVQNANPAVLRTREYTQEQLYKNAVTDATQLDLEDI